MSITKKSTRKPRLPRRIRQHPRSGANYSLTRANKGRAVRRRSTPYSLLPTRSQGLIIVYVGNGKGKTSAAIGLAVRARGWGKRVAFVQFYKSDAWPSGERAALRKLGVDVLVLGEGFVKILGDKKPLVVHRAAARKALGTAKAMMLSKKYDVLIFDEAISCLEQKLLRVSDLTTDIVAKKPKDVTICLTGHDHFKALEKLADTVTEMKMVKHPYYRGILAQRGVDY